MSSADEDHVLDLETAVPEQITNEEQTAHLFGACAVVTGIYRENGVNKGKPYSPNGSWQCVASQSTLILL